MFRPREANSQPPMLPGDAVPSIQVSNLLFTGAMSIAATPVARDIGRSARDENRTPLNGFAWAAVLIGAGPLKIVSSQLGLNPGIWLPMAETILLLCLAGFAAKVRPFAKFTGFILAIAAANFGWEVAVPLIEGSTFAHSLTQQLSWGGQFFVSRFIRAIGAVLMCLTLIGSGIGSRELFLGTGDWRARVKPEVLLPLKRGVSWLRFTVTTSGVLGLVLASFLFSTLHPQVSRLAFFISALPWAVATSVLNAANEEFQFRSVLLARLRNAVPSGEAILLVAAFFGIGHYFGQPGGLGGLVMAAAAAWIWGKSMIETRGFTCAFFSHFIMDFVIFGFLAMSDASFPKS